MNKRLLCALGALAALSSLHAGAQQRAEMNLIDAKGVGTPIGTVEIAPAANGGDNQSDRPKPNGGGGTRIACGVIGEK